MVGVVAGWKVVINQELCNARSGTSASFKARGRENMKAYRPPLPIDEDFPFVPIPFRLGRLVQLSPLGTELSNLHILLT